MKRFGWKTAIWMLPAVALTVVSGYCLLVYRQAVDATPAVVRQAINYQQFRLRAGELPEHWRRILIQVEDPRFFDHNGIDLSTPGAGATTITQGLVKLHYFDRFSPGPLNKLRQSITALVLDRNMDKELQLTLMLNSASLGPGVEGWVYGFDMAAEAYFQRGFSELSDQQFTTLVAMLLAPKRYHPRLNAERLALRVQRIQQLLAGDCAPASLMDVELVNC